MRAYDGVYGVKMSNCQDVQFSSSVKTDSYSLISFVGQVDAKVIAMVTKLHILDIDYAL